MADALVPLSSSWVVQDGHVFAAGAPVVVHGGYHCSTCGARGHNERTCGIDVVERAARRRGSR